MQYQYQQYQYQQGRYNETFWNCKIWVVPGQVEQVVVAHDCNPSRLFSSCTLSNARIQPRLRRLHRCLLQGLQRQQPPISYLEWKEGHKWPLRGLSARWRKPEECGFLLLPATMSHGVSVEDCCSFAIFAFKAVMIFLGTYDSSICENVWQVLNNFWIKF